MTVGSLVNCGVHAVHLAGFQSEHPVLVLNPPVAMTRWLNDCSRTARNVLTIAEVGMVVDLDFYSCKL